MGGSNLNSNFFEACPQVIPDTVIFVEDDFVRTRAQTFVALDARTQSLFRPFWRVQSQYEDIIIPVVVNAKLVHSLRQDINEGWEALHGGDLRNRSIGLLILEIAWSYKVFVVYLSKLRELLASVKRTERATELRKFEMIQEYNDDVNFDPLRSQAYVDHVLYSLNMAGVTKNELEGTIAKAKYALELCIKHMMDMSRIYSRLGMDLPDDPFCRSLMVNCWAKLRIMPPMLVMTRNRTRVGNKIKKNIHNST